MIHDETPLPDECVKEINAQNDIYRGRYTDYKIAIYSAHLAVFGIIIAICSSNQYHSFGSIRDIIPSILNALVILLSLYSCWQVMKSLSDYKDLYDSLGNRLAPKTHGQIDLEQKFQQDEFEKFKATKERRLKRDKSVGRIFLIVLVIMFVIPLLGPAIDIVIAKTKI